MSQKKHKKRKSPQSKQSKSISAPLLRDQKQKRMAPLTRNLLLLDLVFLGIVQLLTQWNKISNQTNAWLCLVGLFILLLALYLQYQHHKQQHKPKGPTL